MEAEHAIIADYDDQAISLLSGLNIRIGQPESSSHITSAMTPQLQPGITSAVSTASFSMLPKLIITPFYGNLHNWITFWDQFKGTMYKNAAISDSDKFHFSASTLPEMPLLQLLNFPQLKCATPMQYWCCNSNSTTKNKLSIITSRPCDTYRVWDRQTMFMHCESSMTPRNWT